MKKTIIIILITILLQSCVLLNINPCKNFVSDAITLRTNSEAISTSIEFSEEKALLMAKNTIAEDIDNYILEKYNYKTFLADSEYEDKVNYVRKTILTNINIICTKTVKKGSMYKSYVAIEISKSNIDNEISKILKGNIE